LVARLLRAAAISVSWPPPLIYVATTARANPYRPIAPEPTAILRDQRFAFRYEVVLEYALDLVVAVAHFGPPRVAEDPLV